MIHKLKCETCNKKFESKRATTKYCSNSCKQKAHYQRVAEREETPLVPTEETHASIFYLDEFQKGKKTDLLVIYCFFRRNIPLKSTLKEIDEYFEATYLNWEYFEENIEKTKPFREFNERFLNGEFKIYTNRFVDGKDIYGVELVNE